MGRRDESIISRCHPCSPARLEPAHSPGTRRPKATDTLRPDNGGVSGGYYFVELKMKNVKLKRADPTIKQFSILNSQFSISKVRSATPRAIPRPRSHRLHTIPPA